MLLAQSQYPLLPDPPPLQYYFLESPWQFLALLLVCGLILLYQANQARSRRFMIWGTLCIACGIILLILATSITTDREALARQNRRIVALAAPLSIDLIKQMLTNDCAFYLVPLATLPTATVDSLDKVAKTYSIDAPDIVRLDVAIDSPDSARSQLWVKARIKSATFGEIPTGITRWELTWQRVDGVWKVHTVHLIEKD